MLDERYRAELIADLCRYVRIPSRSSATGGEEGALQTLIAEQMRAAGARTRTLGADDIPGFRDHPLCHGRDRQYAGRPTVIGEIGPQDVPALLLLAHSDTVQIFEPEKWTMDPFCGEVRDEMVYGLGSSDDKWGLATLLTVMRAFVAAREPLGKRLIFASTIDEENGVGNGALMLVLASVHAEAALYLDGADMQICIGNLGGSNLMLHPRSPIDPNAFALDAERLHVLCAERSRIRAALYEGSYFADNMSRYESTMYRRAEDAGGPFHILNFYTLPGEERAEFCRELEQQVALALSDVPSRPAPAGDFDQQQPSVLAGAFARYTLSYREPWFEPAFVDPSNPIVGIMAAACREVTGEEPCITTISKQDAFVLTNHGRIPTVSFGPARSRGSGAFHKPDESVAIEAVWQCAQIVHRAASQWLAQEGERVRG